MPHFFQPFSIIVPWVPEVFLAQFPVSVMSLSIKTAEAQVAKLATCIFLFPRVPSTYLKQWLAFSEKMPMGLSFRTHASTLVAFVAQHHRHCEMLRVDHASSFTN